MGPVRQVVAVGTYPGLLAFAVLATPVWLSWGQGRLHETLVVSGVLWIAAMGVAVLERLQPRVAGWSVGPRDFGVDALHAVLTAICGATLARMLFFGSIAWASAQAASYGWGIWPDHWPLWAQLPLAVLVSDFVIYWLHRASHKSPLLWRLHEVHHTTERLHTLSSARAHPIYVAVSTAVTTAPLLVLGADPPTLAMLSSFVGVNGLVQHSNIDLRTNWASWLFATADLHRFHHGERPEEQGSNFANTLSLWDAVFSTRRLPDGVPAALGLGTPGKPASWVGHMMWPFRRPAQ